MLNSTKAKNSSKIIEAINSLKPLGTTEGGVGLELAYEIAEKNFLRDGNNKIILATDGAFTSTKKELKKIKSKIKMRPVMISVYLFFPLEKSMVNWCIICKKCLPPEKVTTHISLSVQEGQICFDKRSAGKEVEVKLKVLICTELAVSRHSGFR